MTTPGPVNRGARVARGAGRPSAPGRSRTPKFGKEAWGPCLGLALLLSVGAASGAAARGSGPESHGSAAARSAAEGETLRTPDGLVAVGAIAPDFELADASGKIVRLKDLLGRPLVLYFYPMDETPGCTTEACAFRDDAKGFDSLGVRVVGISTDGTASHLAFAARHKLPFTLLSDTLATVSRAYGVAFDIEVSGSKRTIARRVTFLIDRSGTVRHVWPKVDPAGSSVEVLAALRKLLPEVKR
jgi:thioredoxin-dependent peroxiredoxin